MLKKPGLKYMAVFLAAAIGMVYADASKKPLQSNVAKGVYIQNDLITKENIKSLPIPLTLENYAIYQSIGKVSNVISGEFRTGAKKITLISDKDGDGKVDLLCMWMLEGDTINIDPKPGDIVSPEKFAQMKTDIINGKRGTLTPNEEGVPYLKVLMKTPSNIVRVRNGYRVSMRDPDAMNMERVSYFYSDNGVHGVDMAFQVKYQHIGRVRMQPLVPIWVYCKDSYDPFAVETVKKLISESREHVFPQ